MAGRTVYIATSGEYSDYRIKHVFGRREDAEAYAGADQVEEYEIHDGPVEMREWYTLTWNPRIADRDSDGFAMANPHESHALRDFDGRPQHAEHNWPTTSVLHVEGWDLQRIRKVYSEQRAQHLARVV